MGRNLAVWVFLGSVVAGSSAIAEISNIDHVRSDTASLNLQVHTYVLSNKTDSTAIEPYFDNSGKVFRLSTVTDMNFRLSPATALENFDQQQYDQALADFPSVRDCLVEAEREKAHPDLASFDWANISNHGEAYVCFSLIFTSYETAADVMWWMARQRMFIKRGYAKYRVGGPVDHVSDLQISQDFGLWLSGGFAELPYGGHKATWPFSWFESDGYTVSARFSKSLGLVSISIIAHRMK